MVQMPGYNQRLLVCMLRKNRSRSVVITRIVWRELWRFNKKKRDETIFCLLWIIKLGSFGFVFRGRLNGLEKNRSVLQLFYSSLGIFQIKTARHLHWFSFSF